MAKHFEIVLPKLGESIVEATVVSWLKKEGDKVALDEPLLEVSTDKVNSEIPSPVEGVLEKIVSQNETTIEVGGVLGVVLVEENTEVKAPEAVQVSEKKKPCPASQKSTFISPSVLSLAQANGISMETLMELEGTGDQGRVTKKDVLAYLENKALDPKPSHLKPCESSESVEERIAFDPMRKKIAENMVKSFYEAPHASLVTEVNLTQILQTIAAKKQEFFEKHQAKLTVTSFILKALSETLQSFKMLNASIENETIVLKKQINIGIAVHVKGGLIVPVIKQCEKKSLTQLAKHLGDLAQKARDQKLSLQDVQEGTITLTNFGMAGALIGTPIIRYPEVAIIGVGKIHKKVVINEDNSMAIAETAYVTLTFDHRIVDGIYGCQFLEEFKKNLESLYLN